MFDTRDCELVCWAVAGEVVAGAELFDCIDCRSEDFPETGPLVETVGLKVTLRCGFAAGGADVARRGALSESVAAVAMSPSESAVLNDSQGPLCSLLLWYG